MGKLIKSHLARLLTLVAATIHLLASIYCFFWPKFFFDSLTTNFDRAVKPIPILQTINLVISLLILAWEYPLFIFAAAEKRIKSQQPGQQPTMMLRICGLLTAMHASIAARLLSYPLAALGAILLYQGGNAGLYYIIGMAVYFWAFCEGEIVTIQPWGLPRSRTSAAGTTAKMVHGHGPALNIDVKALAGPGRIV